MNMSHRFNDRQSFARLCPEAVAVVVHSDGAASEGGEREEVVVDDWLVIFSPKALAKRLSARTVTAEGRRAGVRTCSHAHVSRGLVGRSPSQSPHLCTVLDESEVITLTTNIKTWQLTMWRTTQDGRWAIAEAHNFSPQEWARALAMSREWMRYYFDEIERKEVRIKLNPCMVVSGGC